MPLSEDAWKLAGSVAAHQLWTLVEDAAAPSDEPRVMPLLMYVVGDEEKTARLVGTSNVEGAVAAIIAEEAPARHALGVDARVTTGSGKVDALVVMVSEGSSEAVVAIPYRVPFRMQEPMGLPDGAKQLAAFREGLESGGRWSEIRPKVGPLLGEPPDPAPTPTPIAMRRQRRAELREFRLHKGMLQRLRKDGEVRDEFPAEEIRVAIVERRQTVGAVVLLGLGALLLGGATLCGGPWGLAFSAVPATVLALVALVAAMKGTYLEIRHDEGIDRWMLDRDVTRPEAEEFAAAVAGRPSPASLHPGEVVAHLYFTEDPPSDIPDAFIGYARHELIDDVEDHLLAPQGLIYAVVKRGGMNARLYGLLQHLARTRWHVEVRIADGAVNRIAEWGQGIPFIALLPDGTVTDNRLRALLTLGGDSAQGDASLPFPADAIARREVTLAELAAQGLRSVPLPPVIGEREVVLRDPRAAARRALALALIVAPVAGAVTAGDAPPSLDALRDRLGDLVRELTPAERSFVDSPDPDTAQQLSWRLEAAATLFWALGWLDGPLSMSDLVDPERMVRAVAALGEPPSAAVEAAELRPTHELLDLLDRVFCRRWIAVDARVNDKPIPTSLNPSVLLERHHALNWLTHQNNERRVAWDDVETPT